jgi:DNA-binding response OmpR family regulator
MLALQSFTSSLSGADRQIPSQRLGYPSMNVWVVEDERKVMQFLESAFKSEGYAVTSCLTYEEAETAMLDSEVRGEKPDVIILDRMLNQGRDGMSLIKPLKLKFPEVKIVILSAINSPEEKATALDFGADDYVSKPFSLVELSARLRVMSRRNESVPTVQTKLRRLDVEMDQLGHQVWIQGKKADFSNKEYQLLQLFMKNPGRVYNRFQLLDKIWNLQFEVESNVVEVTMKNLRKKLLESGSKLEILSKRNIGYWVEA